MVWVENVSTIVMLTREEEKDTVTIPSFFFNFFFVSFPSLIFFQCKCDRYWPNDGDVVKSEIFTITCEDTQDDKYNVIKKRTLLVKNKLVSFFFFFPSIYYCVRLKKSVS